MVKQISSLSEIRESVNPVFKTARSCVIVNALLGDKDVKKLMGPLGFDMHGSLAITDAVYDRMSSDHANKILLSFNFDEK